MVVSRTIGGERHDWRRSCRSSSNRGQRDDQHADEGEEAERNEQLPAAGDGMQDAVAAWKNRSAACAIQCALRESVPVIVQPTAFVLPVGTRRLSTSETAW